MKIFTNLFLCVLVLCALSCSKDDSQIDLDSLNGSWEVVQVKCDDGVFTTIENGVSHGGAFVFTGKSISTQLHFFEDGSFEGNGTYTQEFTTFRHGEMIVTEEIRNDLVRIGTWKKNENLLELNHEDFQQFEIVQMTGNLLELQLEFEEVFSSDHSTTTKTGTVIYILNRL